MTITLTPEMEAIIIEKMRTGAYQSAEQIVSTGLGLLDRLSASDEDKLRALRQDIDVAFEDVANGRVSELDMEALIVELEERHRNRAA